MNDTQALPTSAQDLPPAARDEMQGAAPAPAPQQAQPQAQPQPQPQQPQPQQPQQPAGQGAVPTTVASSSPPPKGPRPYIDPRPYAALAEQAPQYRAMVDDAAEKTGTSPQRLALTWYTEGGFHTVVPDGKAGEKGPMQMMPTTAASVGGGNGLDPTKLEDSLILAGRHINQLDSAYGKDTPSSVAAYQGGPGSVDDIVAHPDTAMANHPNTMAYVQRAFPGQQVTPTGFTGRMNMDPATLVNAVKTQGPDGMLKYLSQTAAQSGTTMTEAMRSAEATLVGFAAARGDYAGMQHAKDFVLQVAHAGSNAYLMAAHQALQAGDSQSAAGYLAKAHAFFPDGTTGQFGVDNKGQVWGRRIDDHTGQAAGQPFQIDANGVAGMLNQTTDPNKYLAMVQEERKSVADQRHAQAMGDYYGSLLQSRKEIADDKNQTSLGVAGIRADATQGAATTRADATVSAAQIRAAARQGSGPLAKASAQADKEATTNFNEITMPDTDELTRGQMSETYHDVRMNGVTEPQALAVTKGLYNGQLRLVPGRDGNYGVVNPSDKSGHPIALISKGVGDRLAGARGVQPPQQGVPTTPIGAGASTTMARAQGVTSNLSGTVMPSAQAQPAPQPQQSSAIPTE